MDQIKKYAPLLGKWIPTECIGEGGFGSVYRVKDKNGIQKDCAVKLITLKNRQLNLPSAETLSPDNFLKLQLQTAGKSIREIELMDTLGAATNIVTIYNYDIFPGTNTIDILLHMELLTSLSSLMKTEVFDRSEIIRIGMDLCDALISCEKYQIIHRDIKPDNVFRDLEGHYKLGDFGLSRQITASASASLRGVCGTPLYMAPEALIWGKKVSYKTDQYALGIILYQLLNNGKTPFCEDMADPFALEESIQKKLAGEELPPPANENGKLWEIIRKACELEEGKRYPSATEMKQDLQHLLGISKTSVAFKSDDTTYSNTVSAFQTIANEEERKIKVSSKNKPVLMVQEPLYYQDDDGMLFHKFLRDDIKKVIFLDTLSDAPDNAEDLSDKQNCSVLGWLKNGTLSIAGKGGVMANQDSRRLFDSCNNLKKIEFNHCFDTSNVTDMSWMFYGCSSLTFLDLSGFYTSNVTNMQDMFRGCSSLTFLDLSGFYTSNVTDMNAMFCGCNSLTSLDLSDFNISSVKYMHSMFRGCSSLTSLDVSGFDTRNVIYMQDMFRGCSSLTFLDLSGFDTRNVKYMNKMFCGCNSLTSLDFSSFDTRNVKYMDEMFYNCSSLTSLDLSGLDTSNVTDMSRMFEGCRLLLRIKCKSQLKR